MRLQRLPDRTIAVKSFRTCGKVQTIALQESAAHQLSWIERPAWCAGTGLNHANIGGATHANSREVIGIDAMLGQRVYVRSGNDLK